jgi:integrase
VRLTDLEYLRERLRSDVGVATVSRAHATGRRLRAYDPDTYGKGAAENFVRGMRFFFHYARKAELLSHSSAVGLQPPRRPRAPERPLTQAELTQIWDVAVNFGKDPELDELLLTFLRHTAARREGCLNLAIDHLDGMRGSVTLTEKGGETRELPLATWLLLPARATRSEARRLTLRRSGLPLPKGRELGQLRVAEGARGGAVRGEQRERRVPVGGQEVAATPLRKVVITVGEEQAGSTAARATGVVVDGDRVAERDITT